MWVRRALAALAILAGGIGSVLSLLIAFGVEITPDQHTAIASVVSLLLLAVGTLLGQTEVAAYREGQAKTK